MPFWPAFALLWWRGGGARSRAQCGFALALGVVLAPMLWYGWRQTGAPLIADSSGFNLAGGLADRWRSDYIDDAVAPLFGRYLSAPGGPREKNAAMLAAARAVAAARTRADPGRAAGRGISACSAPRPCW